MSYGLAMRRLPAVAAAFRSGDISFDTYRTIVYRTELITDDAAMAEVDRQLAERAARWPSMTRGKLITEIDRVIYAHDRDAVRRAREHTRDRDVTVWDRGDGTSDVSGRLFTTDAALFTKRLDSLAATVCPDDPRTAAQRRADAIGALAVGGERLRCQCGRPDCPATLTGVVIHVVANQSTLRGRGRLTRIPVRCQRPGPGRNAARISRSLPPAAADAKRGAGRAALQTLDHTLPISCGPGT